MNSTDHSAQLEQFIRELKADVQRMIDQGITSTFGNIYQGGKLDGGSIGGTVPPTSLPVATTTTPGITEVDHNMGGAPVAVTTASIGAALGVAGLDAGGHVPVSELPVLGASGGAHQAGIAPDPGAVAGTTRFLREDATYAVPAGVALDANSKLLQAQIPAVITPALDPTTTDGDLWVRRYRLITTQTLGFLGDSLTVGSLNPGTASPTAPQTVATLLSSASFTVTASNQGVGGTTTLSWQPGGANLPGAMAAWAAAGVKYVMVELGTNDAYTGTTFSAAVYAGYMVTICDTLVQNGFTPILNDPPYSSSVSVDNTLIQAYSVQLDAIANGSTILRGDRSNYAYVQAHPGDLGPDGIHFTQTGYNNLAVRWAEPITQLIGANFGPQCLKAVRLGSGLAITVGGAYDTIAATAISNIVYGPISNGTSNPLVLNAQNQIILSRRS